MPYVAVAMTVCILTACSDDPKGIGSSTNQTADNLTAEANKVKFESIGQKVVNEFSNPQAHEELLRAINDFCYLADEYNLDVEKAGAYRATSAYWQTIGEICSTNNLTKTLSLTRTGGEFYRAAQYYGTYTYGNGKDNILKRKGQGNSGESFCSQAGYIDAVYNIVERLYQHGQHHGHGHAHQQSEHRSSFHKVMRFFHSEKFLSVIENTRAKTGALGQKNKSYVLFEC